MPLSNSSLLDEGTHKGGGDGERAPPLREVRSRSFTRFEQVPPANDRNLPNESGTVWVWKLSSAMKRLLITTTSKCASGVMVQYPATGGSVLGLLRRCRKSAQRGHEGCRCVRYLGFDAVEASGRSGARTWLSALRQRFGDAAGLHAAVARSGLLGDHGRVQAFDARRIIGISVDADGNPCLRMASANEGAAHSQRQGDVEHLHERKRCWRTWRRCTPSTTARKAWTTSPRRRTAWQRSSKQAPRRWASTGRRDPYFDTVTLKCPSGRRMCRSSRLVRQGEINIRKLDNDHVAVAFDETTTLEDVDDLFKAFNGGKSTDFSRVVLGTESVNVEETKFTRKSKYLTCATRCSTPIAPSTKW